MSLAADLGQFTAYAAELVIADQLKQAEDFVQKLLQQDATNADAAFLGLLIAQRGGNAQAISAAADQVRAALLTRLSQTGKALAGEAVAPTTQPSTDVNIEADVKQIQQTGDTELGSIYASGLADLAWLEIYFNQKPADAQRYLAALRQILPGDSGTIARLEGWSYLVEGKLEEAKVKLSAVAERDPLARLGILKIESRDPAAAESITVAARHLLMEHSSGLLGAMLIEALRDRVGLMPISPVGAQLRAELDQFPKDWLDLLDLARASRFYNLKAETAKVAHSYGEPMIATVTITNLSSYDLTIGPNGAIRPDLWVDVQIKGLAQQFIAGVAYERMGKQVLLKPKQSISQSLRIDQGPLAVLMTRNPQVELPLFFSIVTNPLSQQGGIAPGPCGQRQQFLKVVTRAAAPLSPQSVQAQIARLLAGTAEERIRTLELLGTFAAALRGQDDANLQGTATEITDVIRKSTGDRVPAVRGAAMFVTAQLADAAVREGILRQMLIDEQFPIRVTGLAAIQMLEPAKRKELAATVVHSDGDEVVRKLAASVIEVADLPPPSTQPQEQPADSATQPTASGTP
jgi:hypothetical protein